jgi:hypothetical protein
MPIVHVYKIGSEVFYSKNSIIKKCRQLLNNNGTGNVKGDDLSFLKDFFKESPKIKRKSIVEISVDRFYNNNAFYIRVDGSSESVVIGYTSIITRLQTEEMEVSEYIKNQNNTSEGGTQRWKISESDKESLREFFN